MINSGFEKEVKYENMFLGQAFGLTIGLFLDSLRNKIRFIKYLVKS